MSEHTTSLYLKLADIMAQVARIPKNGINSHFKYSYVTDVDILDYVRPLLAEHHIMIMPEIVSVNMPESFQLDKAGNAYPVHKKTIIHMNFHVVDGDTGERMMCAWSGEADDAQDKGITKALVSAQKYFLKMLLMISTGDLEKDPDGDFRKKKSTSESSQNAPHATQPNKQAQTPPQPQNAPEIGHWIDNVELRKGFFKWLEQRKISEMEAKGILGVEHFHDYTGTIGVAKTVINAYITANSKKEVYN